MTAFSNTSQYFREHARSFRNVPGLSIIYQVFGAQIHILGTPLTSSIKIISKYGTRVIIYSKLSVINCVHMTAFSNTSQDFREHARSFRNVPGLSITYQVFGAHIHILGTPLTSSIKIIRKYRTRVIIYSKLSVINCVHMTAFSNTSQYFREHARSFRNVPGLSITYQVFGAQIHILGTPLTSSIKIISKYRTRVIIYSKLSVINCVHMTAFSNTCQDFREHARSFRNVPGLSITYQVFGEHPHARVSAHGIH